MVKLYYKFAITIVVVIVVSSNIMTNCSLLLVSGVRPGPSWGNFNRYSLLEKENVEKLSNVPTLGIW